MLMFFVVCCWRLSDHSQRMLMMLEDFKCPAHIICSDYKEQLANDDDCLSGWRCWCDARDLKHDGSSVFEKRRSSFKITRKSAHRALDLLALLALLALLSFLALLALLTLLVLLVLGVLHVLRVLRVLLVSLMLLVLLVLLNILKAVNYWHNLKSRDASASKKRGIHIAMWIPPLFLFRILFSFKINFDQGKRDHQNHSWLCVVFSGVISYWLGQGCVYASSPVTTHIYSHTIIIIIFLLTIFHQHNHLRYHNIYHNHHHQLTKVLDTNLLRYLLDKLRVIMQIFWSSATVWIDENYHHFIYICPEPSELCKIKQKRTKKQNWFFVFFMVMKIDQGLNQIRRLIYF